MAEPPSRTARTAAGVGLSAALLFAVLPVRTISADNVAQLMTAESFLAGDVGLLDAVVPRFAARGLPTRVYLLPSGLDGWVAPYAPGTALLLAPAAAVALALGAPPRWVYGSGLAHLAAAAATGLATAWLWLAVRRLAGTSAAWFAAAAFALGSPALSLLAREPWQQTALAALGAAMIVIASAQRRTVRRWFVLGFLAGVGILVRPTAVLYAVPWGVWAAWEGRREVGAFAAAAAPGAATLAAYQWLHFGAPWRFGQLLLPLAKFGGRGVVAPDPLAAAAGLLLSPGIGLLVYFPAVLLATYALPRRLAPPPAAALARLAWVVFGLSFTAACGYREWWAGWGYGPRYLCDALPYLVLLAGFGFARSGGQRTRRPRTAAALLLVLGGVVNGAGRLIEPYAPESWSAMHDVDHHPEAVWCVTDAPPLYNLRVWLRRHRSLVHSEP